VDYFVFVYRTDRARRQEMKWLCVFFVKKVDLSSTQGALCTVSVFLILHFTYLGGAYAPNAPPAYTGLPTCAKFAGFVELGLYMISLKLVSESFTNVATATNFCWFLGS